MGDSVCQCEIKRQTRIFEREGCVRLSVWMRKKSVCGLADKAMSSLILLRASALNSISTGLLSPSADLNDISNVMGVCMPCVHGHVQTDVCVFQSGILQFYPLAVGSKQWLTLQHPHPRYHSESEVRENERGDEHSCSANIMNIHTQNTDSRNSWIYDILLKEIVGPKI